MKKITSTLLLLAFSLHAQTTQEATQGRIEGTQREQPAPITGQNTNTQEGGSSDASASDTGAQRPISVKKSGISAFFGYDTKFYYRDNPLSQKNTLSQFKTAMWTNTFFGGAGLGVYDLDSAVVTPYIGGSYSINDYLEDAIEPLKLNYNSSSAYALLLVQYANGWSGRIGVNYAMDKSTEFDTEDYSEFFPNIGVMKSYFISDSTIGIFDAYVGTHESTIAEALNTPKGNLDNLEFAASYGLKHNMGDITLYPKYLISHKTYSNGTNNSRDDLTHNLSLKADYPLADSLKLSFFTGYTMRDSSGTTSNLDYENFDGGAGLTLTSRF